MASDAPRHDRYLEMLEIRHSATALVVVAGLARDAVHGAVRITCSSNKQ